MMLAHWRLRASLLAVALLAAPCRSDFNSVLNTVTNVASGAAGVVTQVVPGAANAVTNTAAPAVAGAANVLTQVVATAVGTVQPVLANATAVGEAYATVVVPAAVSNATVTVANASKPVLDGITGATRHPLVFFPAYGTSRLRVDVKNQSFDPACPASASFFVSFGDPSSLAAGIPQECVYSLITLQYDSAPASPADRFANQPGVNTSLPDFGSVACAPLYAPLWTALEAVGYRQGEDLFMACYDSRMHPYTDVSSDGKLLQRAKALVEKAYAQSGNTPVYLGGHSNGPLYALALLASQPAAWRDQYIAGLIAYDGNWAGQGSTYDFFFSGYSLFDAVPYAPSAPAHTSFPATYMSASAPEVYNTSEVVIRTLNMTGNAAARNYTPEDYPELFADAGLPLAEELGALFIGNLTPATTVPGTHFYGFYGSGLSTLVGTTLVNLTQGQPPVNGGAITKPGDGNQEAVDNLSPLDYWAHEPCYHFELNDVGRVQHLFVPFAPQVVSATLKILFSNPPANCSTA